MAQVLFATDTTPSLVDLDANMTELYARIAPVATNYSPTPVGVANVAVTSGNANTIYTQFGAYVEVSGTLQLDPTSASVTTTVGIPLPVASNFSSLTQLAGMAVRVQGTLAPLVAAITGDVTNKRANLTFLNDTDVADRTWAYRFRYQVV